MKSILNPETGKYLTQAAYDAWSDGVTFDGETWGNYESAAIFHPDDAPGREIFDGEFVDALPDIMIGMRVEAGTGEDHDTGRVDKIEDGKATVSWDSLIVTTVPVSFLSPK